MRTVLFGGTDLSLAIAQRIESHLVGVVTIPRDYSISYKPVGARNVRYADLGAWARERNIAACEWESADAAAEFCTQQKAEWGLAAGWYYILPERLLSKLERGVAGLHASLLPKLRGNAPLNWAILRGERETGISMFKLTKGMDDGPLYGQRRIPVPERATIGELVKAAEAAAIELVEDALRNPNRALVEQVGESSYCLAREPADSRIDWKKSAAEIDRLVRASGRPYSGAYTTLAGSTITIWAGEPVNVDVSGTPGQVWRVPDGRVAVLCGDRPFVITECESGGGDGLTTLRRASLQRLE